MTVALIFPNTGFIFYMWLDQISRLRADSVYWVNRHLFQGKYISITRSGAVIQPWSTVGQEQTGENLFTIWPLTNQRQPVTWKRATSCLFSKLIKHRSYADTVDVNLTAYLSKNKLILEWRQHVVFVERRAIRTPCYTPSPRRPYEEYKRMVLEHTHGLFIT